MANTIKEYNPDIPGLRPSETGIDATLLAARRASASYNEVADAATSIGKQNAQMVRSSINDVGGQVVAFAEHQEISHGAAAYAGLNDDLTKKWNETVKNADPNDPGVADRFREKVMEPELEKFKNGFLTDGGQKWGETRLENLRNHMFTKTAADMSSLAADAVAVNMKQTANTMSNTAVQDPSSVPQLLKDVDATVGPIIDANPHLKGEVGQKAKLQLTQTMKEKVVASGAMSAIQMSGNPEATAAQWAAKYPEFINGSEALTLAKAARTALRFNEAQDKAARLYEKQAAALDADKAGAALVSTIIKPDGSFQPAGPEYFQKLRSMLDPTSPDYKTGLGTAKAIELLKFGQTEQAVKASDPDVKSSLQSRLIAGGLDPMDIIKATNEGKLSHADAGIMEQQRKLIDEHPVNNAGLKNVFEGAKASLVIPTNHSDFMQEFLPMYLEAKTKGTLKPGDLNFSDPNSMVSKVLANHQPTQAEKVQFQTLKNVGMGIQDPAKANAILNAPQLPAGMTVEDAVKTYGKGTIVKNSRGDLVTLPK